MTDIIIPDEQHLSLEDIDNYLDQWTMAVQQASEQHIPKISYRTIPGIKPTAETRQLQIQYNAAIV